MDENRLTRLLEEIRDLQRQQVEAYGRALKDQEEAVLYEEPTLRRRFGMPYVAYLALVNRWVPKLPKRS
jgi:hypothetical protein